MAVPLDPLTFPCHLIHNVPEYIEATATLINAEWPRTLISSYLFTILTKCYVRVRNLESSCDGFPANLILLDQNSTVVAHCRLSLVNSTPDAVLIETVVVSKDLRGLGLGKRIMIEAESYAKSKGLKVLYLSTHDKQDFYRHLGYAESEAVTVLGASGTKLNVAQLSGLLAAFGGNAQSAHSNDGRTWMKKPIT